MPANLEERTKVLHGQNGRVSTVEIEEILLVNVVCLMLRTSFEGALEQKLFKYDHVLTIINLLKVPTTRNFFLFFVLAFFG